MSSHQSRVEARENARGTSPRRERSRRTPTLVAADDSSLAELELLIATLPPCATGRVFVEVAETSDAFPLSVPPRMTVTFLSRSARSGEPGTGRACAPGTALTRAVTAWADEMMCGAPGDAATSVHVLAAYLPTADIVDHLTERRGVEASSIHTPERFGLQTAR